MLFAAVGLEIIESTEALFAPWDITRKTKTLVHVLVLPQVSPQIFADSPGLPLALIAN